MPQKFSLPPLNACGGVVKTLNKNFMAFQEFARRGEQPCLIKHFFTIAFQLISSRHPGESGAGKQAGELITETHSSRKKEE